MSIDTSQPPDGLRDRDEDKDVAISISTSDANAHDQEQGHKELVTTPKTEVDAHADVYNRGGASGRKR